VHALAGFVASFARNVRKCFRTFDASFSTIGHTGFGLLPLIREESGRDQCALRLVEASRYSCFKEITAEITL
jgi:hypothetical protein